MANVKDAIEATNPINRTTMTPTLFLGPLSCISSGDGMLDLCEFIIFCINGPLGLEYLIINYEVSLFTS